MNDQTTIHGDQFTNAGGVMGVAKDQATVIQYNYSGVSSELFAEYVKKLALTETIVEKFLKSLEQEGIPRAEWGDKLQEIAAQYTELLQRLDVIRSEDQQVVALKTQARQAIEHGEFDKAETLLNQAEARDLDAIEQLEATAKQRRLSAAETNADNARLQEIRLRYAKAAEYWRQAAKRLPDGEQQKRAWYLNAAGYDFHRIARYADALPLWEQSLAIRQAIGDKAGEGATLNNLSQIYDERGDYATALRYLEQSLAIQQEIGDKKGEGATLNNLSQIFKARGDYATALRYLEQSLAISQEIGNKAHEGGTLTNLATIAYSGGDYPTALRYLEQSLAIQQEIGDKKMEGTTLNNLSQIYQARGDDATALRYLEQSLAIQQEIGDKKGESATLNNLAGIAMEQGDYATALRYLEQSLAIRQEIGDIGGMCATLFNIGHIHWQHEDFQQAMEHWVAVYQFAQPRNLAQPLKALENLAGKLGLPGGLAFWETLAQQSSSRRDG